MALFEAENIVNSPIGEGDAGIIIKSDGSWRVFNTHKLDPSQDLTDMQKEQGEKLIALAIALKYPSVMAILTQMASDPSIVDPDDVVSLTKH